MGSDASKNQCSKKRSDKELFHDVSN